MYLHDAAKATAETLVKLEALAKESKVLVIGEIGLDYHYDLLAVRCSGEDFVDQLKLVVKAAKPIAIHTREACMICWPRCVQHWTAAASTALF